MKIFLIAIIDQANGLGKNNKLLCHIPEDLKHFRSLTEHHPVIMGRKTFESLNSTPLSNRTNIVITTHPEKLANLGVIAVSSLKQALIEAEKVRDSVFIIGGAKIYKLAMPLADRLYITHIYQQFPADSFFPPISPTDWITAKVGPLQTTSSGVRFNFCEYKKRLIKTFLTFNYYARD